MSVRPSRSPRHRLFAVLALLAVAVLALAPATRALASGGDDPACPMGHCADSTLSGALDAAAAGHSGHPGPLSGGPDDCAAPAPTLGPIAPEAERAPLTLARLTARRPTGDPGPAGWGEGVEPPPPR